MDFVELLRIEDGIVREQVKTTDYNIFKDELARRTYDESGDCLLYTSDAADE